MATAQVYNCDSLNGVIEIINHYQEETNSAFVGTLDQASFLKTIRTDCNVLWSMPNVSNTPGELVVPFTGVPFVFLGEVVLRCSHSAVGEMEPKRNSSSPSDQSGCSATIKVIKLSYFPQFKIASYYQQFRTAAALAVRKALKNKSITINCVYKLRIPSLLDHGDHFTSAMDPIASSSALSGDHSYSTAPTPAVIDLIESDEDCGKDPSTLRNVQSRLTSDTDAQDDGQNDLKRIIEEQKKELAQYIATLTKMKTENKALSQELNKYKQGQSLGEHSSQSTIILIPQPASMYLPTLTCGPVFSQLPQLIPAGLIQCEECSSVWPDVDQFVHHTIACRQLNISPEDLKRSLCGAAAGVTTLGGVATLDHAVPLGGVTMADGVTAVGGIAALGDMEVPQYNQYPVVTCTKVPGVAENEHTNRDPQVHVDRLLTRRETSGKERYHDTTEPQLEDTEKSVQSTVVLKSGKDTKSHSRGLHPAAAKIAKRSRSTLQKAVIHADDVMVLTCAKCREELQNIDAFVSHVESCLQSVSINTDDLLSKLRVIRSTKGRRKGPKASEVGPTVCGECGKTFSSLNVLKSHQKFVHSKEVHLCSQCPKTFKRPELVKCHEQTHLVKTEGDEKHQCTSCGKLFKTLSSLRNHERREQGLYKKLKPFKCTINKCRTHFSTEEEMEEHKRQLHSGNLPFPCPNCWRSFPCDESLAIHMERHRTEWTFECEVCQGKFKTRQHLGCHQKAANHISSVPKPVSKRTKSGKKAEPYGGVCGHCGKEFKTQSNLQRHTLQEMGLLKQVHHFKCLKCRLNFSSDEEAIEHRRQVHGRNLQYQCAKCWQSFNTYQLLSGHSRRHFNEWNWKCDVCSRVYKCKKELFRHKEAFNHGYDPSMKRGPGNRRLRYAGYSSSLKAPRYRHSPTTGRTNIKGVSRQINSGRGVRRWSTSPCKTVVGHEEMVYWDVDSEVVILADEEVVDDAWLQMESYQGAR